MDMKEVFDAITSVHKWYIGYCSQQVASAFMKRFRLGRVRMETFERFANHFGYTKQLNWVNKDEK